MHKGRAELAEMRAKTPSASASQTFPGQPTAFAQEAAHATSDRLSNKKSEKQ